MTIQEAINHAKEVAEEKYKEGFLCYANSGDTENDKKNDECVECAKEHEKLAEWLEELQRYRTIGTVEECRESMERQKAKKPIMKSFYEDMEEEYLCCPTCGDILTDRMPMSNKDFYFHCLNCGQKFLWERDDE